MFVVWFSIIAVLLLALAGLALTLRGRDPWGPTEKRRIRRPDDDERPPFDLMS